MSNDVASVNKKLKAEVTLPPATFRQLIEDGMPGEEAAWTLGKCLGHFEQFADFKSFRDRFGPRWIYTPLGNGLYDALDKLRDAGLLTRYIGETKDYEYAWPTI